ncbi:MAG: hypothetical protein AAF478_06880 [Pseudomonadota bacterium]
MKVLKYISFIVLGAVLGFVLTVVAGYPLLVALEGGRDINGGIAMGVFFQLGPVGGVIGALIGMILAAATDRDPKKEQETEKKSGKGGIIIIGSIMAVVFGYFLLLAYVKGPAPISLAEADVQFEVRTPTSFVSKSGEFTVGVDLFDHYTKEAIIVPVTQTQDGENLILTGKYRAKKNYQRMRLRAHLSPELTLSATVPTLPAMELKPGYTEWIKVGYLENPVTGDSELGYNQRIHMYRYQPVEREN